MLCVNRLPQAMKAALKSLKAALKSLKAATRVNVALKTKTPVDRVNPVSPDQKVRGLDDQTTNRKRKMKRQSKTKVKRLKNQMGNAKEGR